MPTEAADPRTARIGAIVLAAGRSRRFGSANKLLVPLRGEPLLWHTLDAVCASRARPIIVVLGHQHQRLRETLRRYRRARRAPPIRCVFNRWHRSGMASSLQLGLAALPADRDGALICLGDMPMLRASTLEQLRLAYRRGDDAVLPMIAGRRGNPALLGRPLFAAVRQALRGDEGARRL
ncbi:MAG TPA: nucleotidyltransferase family protein, partial [Solimonas sp.]